MRRPKPSWSNCGNKFESAERSFQEVFIPSVEISKTCNSFLQMAIDDGVEIETGSIEGGLSRQRFWLEKDSLMISLLSSCEGWCGFSVRLIQDTDYEFGMDEETIYRTPGSNWKYLSILYDEEGEKITDQIESTTLTDLVDFQHKLREVLELTEFYLPERHNL